MNVIDANIVDGATIEVYWQDEVSLDVDVALMYVKSGQKEIDAYVQNVSKPDIDSYIETEAKPIVSEVVVNIAQPTVYEYIENTVKPDIDEFTNSRLDTYNANAEEKTAIFNATASESVEIVNAGALLATEQATIATTQATNAETSALSASQSASNAKTSETNAKASEVSAKQQADKIAGKITSIEGAVGDIGFSAFGIDESQNKRRYLNGQVISQVQFVSFTNKIKEAVALYPNIATTEGNWQAEVTNSKLGQCGKFVIDDELGTIRLPKVVNVQGLADLSLMGSIKAESLPNITGKIEKAITNSAQNDSGAFKRGVFTANMMQAGSYGNYDLEFDASLSSSTYQNNAPVQQEAIQYPYFIQVATGVEESVDVTREIELNNPFSLLDYKWSEYELSNASWLLSNGQFNSGATYISVYNLLLEIYNGTVTKDGVSVKMSTEAYEDTDFVINTADTTFRLPIKVKLASGNAVVGNGTNIGFVTGVTNIGASPILGTGYDSSNNYVAIGSNPSIPVGVTTDPTKSGLVLADNDMYLYFYVGETIQDANVIAASQVLSAIPNKANINLSNVTNVVQSFKEQSVGWGMPDYSAQFTLTANEVLTADFDMLCIHRRNFGSSGGSDYFYIYQNDGVTVAQELAWRSYGGGNGMYESSETIIIPKGTKFKYTSTTFKFYPLKGVN